MQPISRRIRNLAALLALVATLFAQGAIAMHACMRAGPAVAVETAHSDHAAEPSDHAAATSVHRTEPGCAHERADASNACRAHCEPGVKSAEPAQSPFLALPQLQPVAALPPVAPHELLRTARGAPLLVRAEPPPHSILHCCFRN